MQDYKVRQGSWPTNPIIILLFILVFEVVCYYLFAPLLELVKAG